MVLCKCVCLQLHVCESASVCLSVCASVRECTIVSVIGMFICMCGVEFVPPTKRQLVLLSYVIFCFWIKI